MSDVSVVIPNWNREDLLDAVLRSLEGQLERAAEILVVDNGSTDRSVECARRHGARVLPMDANQGFSHAVNRGIEACRTAWILVLNNDVELEPGFLAHLRREAETRDAWFAVPCLLDAERPERLDGAFDLLSRGACAWRAGHGQPDSPSWREPRAAAFPPLTATLLRRDLFERAGLLDERFESYLEDVDFGLRCALAGCGGVYVPQARARHRGGATLGAWSPAMVRLIARNQLYLVAKHYPPHWFRHYGWHVVVGQLLWGLLALRRGAGLAWLRGKWEGLRSFSRLRPAKRFPARAQKLAEVLLESEKQLRVLTPASGDRYWRIYFALTD